MTGKATNSTDALDAWRAVRADGAIQFAPAEFKPPQPPKPPAWLEWLGKMLDRLFGWMFEAIRALFEPLGKLLGISWPVMQWVLLALAAAAVAFILWRVAGPLLARLRDKAAAAPEPEWQPVREEALALLGDADRLAAEGRFDEATHLLLRRSVGQIRQARPGLLAPSSTAREIARLSALPERARAAFALIATRVERALFALSPLGVDDWQAARAAYADFALAEIGA